MPSEHLEIVRAHIEAFVATDTERSSSFMDEHVVRDWRRIGILDPAGYGIEGVIEGVRHYRAAFDDYDFAIEALTDLGAGQVLAEIAETGRGRESGAPVERSLGVIYTVIDGKIARITAFPSVAEARAALGAKRA